MFFIQLAFVLVPIGPAMETIGAAATGNDSPGSRFMVRVVVSKHCAPSRPAKQKNLREPSGHLRLAVGAGANPFAAKLSRRDAALVADHTTDS